MPVDFGTQKRRLGSEVYNSLIKRVMDDSRPANGWNQRTATLGFCTKSQSPLSCSFFIAATIRDV